MIMGESSANPWRRAEIFLWFSAILYYVTFVARGAFRVDGELFFSLFDDAMISMTYARNLADGYGLVWNPGEPAVEGYTNFLWTLVMAGAHLFGLPDSKTSLLVQGLAGLCLFANAAVTVRIADKLSKGKAVVRLSTLALTLFAYPLVFWSLRGMEVGILTLFVQVGVLAAFELFEGFSWRWLGAFVVVCVLALLTRPDSVVPLILLSAFAVFTAKGKDRLRVALSIAMAVGLTAAAQTYFRWVYYHDTLPNTYYLKVYGTPLFERLSTGIPPFLKALVLELWPFFLVPLATAVRFPERAKDLRKLLLFLLFAAQCAYSVYVGGDAWEHLAIANRYISIALPAAIALLGVLLGEAFEDSDPTYRRELVWILVAGVVLAVPGQLYLRFGLDAISHHFIQTGALAAYLAFGVLAAGLLLAALFFRGGALLAKPGRAWPVLVLAALWLITYGARSARWAVRGEGADDELMARLGVAVAAVTAPKARIGVVYAGAPPYFSHRPSVDLMGKCDPVIARQPSYLPFLPGHSKWNYKHSIETYHPDLLLQTWRLNARDRSFLADAGYVRLKNGVYYHRGSTTAEEHAVESIPFEMRHGYEEL